MSFLRCFYKIRPVLARPFSVSSKSLSRFKDIATCHEILGVKVDSTKEQIKEAFFEKSKQLHPDVDTGDLEKFKELNDAYTKCLNYVRAPNDTLMQEYQDHAKEKAESKESPHSPFIVENFIEYSIIFSICFVAAYFVADALYRFHPLSDGLSSLDESSGDKLVEYKRQIAKLEQEQYEWQARHKELLSKQAASKGS